MHTFGRACSLVEKALSGSARQEHVADLARSKDFRRALMRLRENLRTHVFRDTPEDIDLSGIIATYDSRTRAEGIHVLHDWDGKADRVNEESIPVDVLNYVADRRGGEAPDASALAILLDYYFLYVLALLSMRAWDEGSADDNLDRIDALLQHLQGPGGSGQRFGANAETLLLIATSHFELHEWGYDRLLAKVRTLDQAHQTNVALGHATSMGCHLRFGFEATYGRDTSVMRNDNVADYPWLCFSVATLMREYARLREHGASSSHIDPVVEALLNGLTPDARAFVGPPPGSLAACEAERAGFLALFRQCRDDLHRCFERYRPSDAAYSPISFFFNFSHNVLKGTVVDALLRGEPWRLTLNDLLTSIPRDIATSESKETLARTLMGYARANPDRIRGRLMPVIVYDPQAGRQAFSVTMRKLRE